MSGSWIARERECTGVEFFNGVRNVLGEREEKNLFETLPNSAAFTYLMPLLSLGVAKKDFLCREVGRN